MRTDSREFYERFRQAKEAELEAGILQPACGCRVEWTWSYTAQHYLPAAACVTRIEPCQTAECVGQQVAEIIAESIGNELNKRLSEMLAKFDAADRGETITDPLKETMPEFEKRYTAAHPGTVFGETDIAMPCTCEDGGGPTHWAAIRNTPEALQAHREHEKCLAEMRR